MGHALEGYPGTPAPCSLAVSTCQGMSLTLDRIVSTIMFSLTRGQNSGAGD